MSLSPRRPALFDLTGKLALVTGCRRGIGLAMAEVLAQAGADVIGASAQLEPAGSEVQHCVEAAGGSFTGFRVDFERRDEVRAFAAAIATADRPVDILVNNAGTISRAPAAEHDDERWDTVLEVNLTAPFVLTREIGRGMLERGRGKVIFTASLLSIAGGRLRPGLHGLEVGARRARQGALQRVGRARSERERHRPWLHRHRQHRGAARRSRAQPCDPRADSGGPVG